MRIAVLGSPRSGSHPRVVRMINTLAAARHDVVFISSQLPCTRIAEIASEVVAVDTRWPDGESTVAGLLRRLNPPFLRERVAESRMTTALKLLGPDIVYPTDSTTAAIADRLGFPVALDQRIRADLDHDMADEERYWSPSGSRSDGTVGPEAEAAPRGPRLGRHAGIRITLCYNPTPTTPGRYLAAALERAGAIVDHRYPEIDLTTVPSDTVAVMFIESPYPSLAVSGTATCPVLFWVHHGEHHLYRNLRLADRYRADAVLLAHSWHLDHRFVVPTFRFPFGVPIEMLAEPIPWSDRTLDAAMIGAGFDSDDGKYQRRRTIARRLTESLGTDRVSFKGGLSPEEVFSEYETARTVVDDGGELHRPITMRVFEALGSGAALVTDIAPGLETLLRPELDFLTLDADDPVRSLELDQRAASVGSSGHRRVMERHTYDHRVDELITIIDGVNRAEKRPIAIDSLFFDAVSGLAEIDSLSCGERRLASWRTSSYVVRSHEETLRHGGSVDALLIERGDDLTFELLDRAHRYVLCSTSVAPTVQEMLTDTDRRFDLETVESTAVFDLRVPGYLTRGPA